MNKLVILIILLICSAKAHSQNIHLTFTGTGESTLVDSLSATNLKTNESITIPGSETIILEMSTGIKTLEVLSSSIRLFPNPFRNTSKLTFNQSIPGPVQITINNLMGQNVYWFYRFMESGTHNFSFSPNTPGIYFIKIICNREQSSIKAICTEANNRIVGVLYAGADLPSQKIVNVKETENFETTNRLSYSRGDLIAFKGISGIFKTTITDSPISSRNYEIDFIDCTDPDDRTYEIVIIGDQVWMAENLAYLPEVSNIEGVSVDEAQYHVWGYYGISVDEAKTTEKFKKFGVLYNWEAAQTACPVGWHLPSDEEFTLLSNYLIGNGYGYEGNVNDIGKALASRAGWITSLISGEVGNDQQSNNSSGYNALPGGGRYEDGEFHGPLSRCHFWTSTGGGLAYGWGRYLSSFSPVVKRLYYQRTYSFSVRCLKN